MPASIDPEQPAEKPVAENSSEDLANRVENAGTQAREQAAEYGGIFTSTPLRLDDGTVIHVPPDPRHRLLDDDQMAAYDALLFESESYDRGDEVVIPPQKVYDGDKNVVTELPAQTRPGILLTPYRKDGELLQPAWEVRVVEAALGPTDYARLRAGTIDGVRGSSRHIQQIWVEHNRAIRERQAADSKSAGGTVDLAPVPEADSGGTAAEGDAP